MIQGKIFGGLVIFLYLCKVNILLIFVVGILLGAVITYWLTSRVMRREADLRLDALQKTTAERANAEKKAQEERENYHNQQLKLLKEQFETTAQRLLKQRSEELEQNNSRQMQQLVNPLQQEMANVRRLMQDTRSANEKSTSSLEGALKAILIQSEQLGKDASNLADALKNRGKVHGDWGELVLADILQGSGLREGTEFTTQESFKSPQGELRPDVVVNCPGGSRIIVDSKVSLTAYADYVGAATDIEREEAIKRNCQSVKQHIRELAEKQYPQYVEGAINYVLMFIPNEGAYVLAMNHDQALAQNAFRQGVVIVNPTNLMLTLNLVLQSWQNTRQEDNCRQIIDSANKMYEKMIGLVDTYNQLGLQLETAQKSYQKGLGQLSDGRGNLLKQVENLKELGVTSTKKAKVRKVVTTEPQLTASKEEIELQTEIWEQMETSLNALGEN